MEKQTIKLVTLIGGAWAVGGVTGYIVAVKRLEKRYFNLAEAEIESVKYNYKLLRKEGEFETPETSLVAYGHSLDDLGYSGDEDEEPEEAEEVEDEDSPPVAVTRNVFSDAEKVEENELRDPLFPYVISADEFLDDRTDFDKVSVAYFTHDKTLCGEDDQSIDDIEGNIGVHNLERFGEGGSLDESLVYVRNEQRGVDFEVSREESSYSSMILGLDEDVSGKKERPRKSRADD